MSISFTAEDSPRGEDRVYECQCAFDGNWPADHCPECDGAGEVRFQTLKYEMNLATSNALPFTQLLTPDGVEDYSGRVPAEDIGKTCKKVRDYILNNLENSYIRSRGKELLDILTWADLNNKSVTWG